MPDWLLWTLIALLFLVGLGGCLVPILPGTGLIFATAVAAKFFGPSDRPDWWGLAILLALLALSAVLDFAATGWSTRKFGGSRWGALGAILGTLVGAFFFPFGLVIGPFVGAVAGELITRRKQIAAGEHKLEHWPEIGKPAAGSLLGILINSVGQLILGVLMIAVFLLDSLLW